MLLFGQCIRSMSVKKSLGWMHSIAFIFVLDAYHAPYKRRHRYWTELIYYVSKTLYIISCFCNQLHLEFYPFIPFCHHSGCDENYDHQTRITQVYRQVYIEMLNFACFVLNLGALSATVYYLLGKRLVQGAVTASLSLSFNLLCSLV